MDFWLGANARLFRVDSLQKCARLLTGFRRIDLLKITSFSFSVSNYSFIFFILTSFYFIHSRIQILPSKKKNPKNERGEYLTRLLLAGVNIVERLPTGCRALKPDRLLPGVRCHCVSHHADLLRFLFNTIPYVLQLRLLLFYVQIFQRVAKQFAFYVLLPVMNLKIELLIS